MKFKYLFFLLFISTFFSCDKTEYEVQQEFMKKQYPGLFEIDSIKYTLLPHNTIKVTINTKLSDDEPNEVSIKKIILGDSENFSENDEIQEPYLKETKVYKEYTMMIHNYDINKKYYVRSLVSNNVGGNYLGKVVEIKIPSDIEVSQRKFSISNLHARSKQFNGIGADWVNLAYDLELIGKLPYKVELQYATKSDFSNMKTDLNTNLKKGNHAIRKLTPETTYYIRYKYEIVKGDEKYTKVLKLKTEKLKSKISIQDFLNP